MSIALLVVGIVLVMTQLVFIIIGLLLLAAVSRSHLDAEMLRDERQLEESDAEDPFADWSPQWPPWDTKSD